MLYTSSDAVAASIGAVEGALKTPEPGSLLSAVVSSTTKSASARSSCCRALSPYISARATYVLTADQISWENGYQTLTSLDGVHID